MRHRFGNYFKRHWRVILNIVTFVALALLIYFIRDQILQTLRDIKHVNYWALLLIIPLQLLDYDAYARMYRTILVKIGYPVRYRSMYRVALELNFVNHVFPSGGISGFSFFGVRLKDYNVRPATATIIQLLKFILIFVSFQVLLAVGLIALAIGGKASNLMILVAGVLATLTVVGTLLVAYIVGDKGRITGTFTFLTKLVNRIIHVIRPHHPETISLNKVRGAMNEMHENYKFLQQNFDILKRCFWFALIANICEIMTVYVVYIAFGEWVNIGAVIIAYAIANFAGLVSVLPGGVGIYEALMTGVLAAGGVPAALSIPVIVMYRVLAISIQIIPGWILYHLAMQRAEAAANG